MSDDALGERASALAAALFAVDPAGLGGVVLRAGAGPLRDAWLASLVALLPADSQNRRIPLHVDADRLLGGLDLAATLQAGRPIALRGLLVEAHGGIVTLAMAERVGASTAAAISAALDTHEVVVERHGIGTRSASRFGIVAFDEGIADDERMPARLSERLAFHVLLEGRADVNEHALFTREDIARARARFAAVRIDDDIVESLCAAALALGVDSPRATLFACRAARAAAALDDRLDVNDDDAALAAALVLSPRATRVPASPMPAPEEPPDPPPAEEPVPDESERSEETPSSDGADDDGRSSSEPALVDDVVLEAALAAIPPGLLASLALGRSKAPRAASAGRVGAAQLAKRRGRPMGARRAGLQAGARLDLMQTLRAAAPWQAMRKRNSVATGSPSDARILVRQEDFCIRRFRQRSETTTIFVVDASGSAALHRLAETKGAVELLLADCYVRRDSVAVIAFRGARAELLLSPTRSLVRAKRSLAGLPGGGGTPLASGIASAATLVDAVRRRGATPVVVLLTDGRANIARDGTPGRVHATEDALFAAQQLRLQGVASLLLDTSPQAQEPARVLAAAMGARYLFLPYAGASAMSQAVRTVGAEKPSAR